MPALETIPISSLQFLFPTLELVLLTVIIVLLSKILGVISSQKTPEILSPAAVPVSAGMASANMLASSGTSAGDMELENVDEETAAVIIAIMSDSLGVSLDRLSFKSIRRID